MAIDNRGNNVWRFRIKKDGESFTKTFKGTEKQAQKAHDAFVVDIERGDIGLNENMKFNDLAQLVMDNYIKIKCSYNTYEQYKNCFNTHILDYFGLMKISNIKPLHIQKFINNLLDKGLSSNTIYSNLTCLSKSLSLAVKWHLILKNPCINIDKPQKKKRNYTELLTIDQIQQLFEIYDDMTSKPSQIHRLAFYIAIGCGLRNSEIRALTIDDIDFENNVITVNKQDGRYLENGKIKSGNITTKSDSSTRKIYAPEFVMNNLRKYIDSMSYIPITKQIFWSHKGNKPILRQTLSSYFTKVLTENNLPIIDFHDLRHIHATLLVNKGVNVKSLSSRLGHSKIETTNIYMHTIEQIDKQAAHIINNAISDIKKGTI